MEAFKIWAALNIKGNALSEMEKFARLVTKSNIELAKLQKSLGILSKEFGALSGSLLKDNVEFKAMGENLSAVSRATTVLTGKTQRLSASLKSVASSGSLATKSMGKGVAGGMLGGMMTGGNIALGAAAGAGFLLHSGFEHQKEYQKRLAQLQALGFSPTQMGAVESLANKQIPGVSKIDMLESIVAAQMATRAGPGQFGEVQALAPQLAKARLATNVMFGGMTEKQQQDLIRFAEIQGGSDPKKQAEWLKAGTAMMITSGGSIMPNRQLQFSQLTAGSMRLTPEAYLALEPILQELQSRTGTGLTTGMRALGGGMTMTGFSKKSIKFWEKVGLFQGEFDKAGRPLGVHMPAKYSEMAAQDPLAFLKNVMLPLLGKAGYKTDEDVHKALLELPRTFSMVAWTYYKNMSKSDRAREMAKNVMGGNELQSMLSNNPAFASARVSAAWSSFATAFGTLTSPTVVHGLNAISTILESLTRLLTYWGTNDKTLRASIQGAQTSNITALSNMTPFTRGVTAGAITLSPANNKTFGSYTPGYYGGYSAATIGEPHKENGTTTVTGNVYLDKRKVGEILTGNLNSQLSSAGTISSPTSVNPSYGMPPVGLTNYGGQQ